MSRAAVSCEHSANFAHLEEVNWNSSVIPALADKAERLLQKIAGDKKPESPELYMVDLLVMCDAIKLVPENNLKREKIEAWLKTNAKVWFPVVVEAAPKILNEISNQTTIKSIARRDELDFATQVITSAIDYLKKFRPQ